MIRDDASKVLFDIPEINAGQHLFFMGVNPYISIKTIASFKNSVTLNIRFLLPITAVFI
jgi:hypothetical protein